MSLDITVTFDGGDVVIERLERFDEKIVKEALPESVKAIVYGVGGEALALLNGRQIGLSTTKAKSGRQRTAGIRPWLHGGYPVPRLKGNLLRLLGSIVPGQTKSVGGVTYTAGPLEGIVFNSAEYADVIHEGRGTSAKYGQRAFLDDAFSAFNANGRAVKTIEDQIKAKVKDSGLE